MDPRNLAIRDLRRLVSEMWTDQRCDVIAPSVLDAAVGANAKSCDRAVLTAYLRHFPSTHPAFERLRAMAAFAADRRDWPWRERGQAWRLWNSDEGPETIAAALLARDDPASVLREAGLDGDLAQGEFVAEAVQAACQRAGEAIGTHAEELGERLIELFEDLKIGGLDPALASGLLLPWIETNPSKDHRDAVTKLLLTRVGDPRFQIGAWQAVIDQMPDPRAEHVLWLIRRWLTDSTVREFFKVVGTTTNDPAQWAEREAFWMAYLDAGSIDTAWFALGSQAEQVIRSSNTGTRVDYGRIIGGSQYADPSHSSLVLSIGDLRIAEWSHNGSCRFWQTGDRTAPEPFAKQYFGYQLRAMNGGGGFDYLSHHSRWQWRFAKKISESTGVSHPRFGSGHG